MLVDGARADAKNFADFAIGLAAADPQEHFGFAVGQGVALSQQAFFGSGADFGDAEQPRSFARSVAPRDLRGQRFGGQRNMAKIMGAIALRLIVEMG